MREFITAGEPRSGGAGGEEAKERRSEEDEGVKGWKGEGVKRLYPLTPSPFHPIILALCSIAPLFS
jgi:hypothetical protein